MISAGDFRNGVTFEMDGQVVSIIEFPVSYTHLTLPTKA